MQTARFNRQKKIFCALTLNPARVCSAPLQREVFLFGQVSGSKNGDVFRSRNQVWRMCGQSRVRNHNRRASGPRKGNGSRGGGRTIELVFTGLPSRLAEGHTTLPGFFNAPRFASKSQWITSSATSRELIGQRNPPETTGKINKTFFERKTLTRKMRTTKVRLPIDGENTSTPAQNAVSKLPRSLKTESYATHN